MPVSGKKSGHFAFYIKESRRIFFSFYSLFRLTIRPLSRLEKRSSEFSTERERRFFVWKKRGKLRFSTVCRRSPAESAPHAVFAPECVRNRAIACVPSRSVPSKKTPSVTVHAMNCTPFVRQYGILFRKWGVFVCQRDNESTTERRR